MVVLAPPFSFAASLSASAAPRSDRILTLGHPTANINESGDNSHLSPRRLARPRTPPFHGDNTGSNPVGDAKVDKIVRIIQRVA
jgi:hypothetical protein